MVLSKIKSIRGGLQAAANRARLAYGRDVGGVTFHGSLRHTAASLMAELGESEAIEKKSWGIAISPPPSDTSICDPFTRYRRSSA